MPAKIKAGSLKQIEEQIELARTAAGMPPRVSDEQLEAQQEHSARCRARGRVVKRAARREDIAVKILSAMCSKAGHVGTEGSAKSAVKLSNALMKILDGEKDAALKKISDGSPS